MNKTNLITASQAEDLFTGFKNDKERIKYMSNAYRNMSIAKAFSLYYGIELPNEVKNNKIINTITSISVGNVYVGTVKSISKTGVEFDIPGVKEEIYSKENINYCYEAVQSYLATHDNKLAFEVREKKDNKYIVSIISGYYKLWADKVNKMIERGQEISVHIDDLVKGGYVCHTDIDELNELTGKSYTHSVFIPGSHIVLNIERNFEKWIGEDVSIIPQKFVDYKTIGYGPNKLIEKSLVGSRKLVLQSLGIKNLYDIYNDIMLKQKLASSGANVNVEDIVFDGTITGPINSSKKTGVFIELDGKYITGLMPTDSFELFNYRSGEPIKVKIKEFEVQEGKEPFIINKKGNVVKCNVRPVFEKA